ncbi:recombinase family protein [Mycobacterium heckeshornense]|uniref:Uncharacterized protein n=1 Tax=Mycobacterium heckeshornense TaxID=110505 RepID=A0A7R7TRL9_9MYCO|nr:recombinase family protein [Mycobacterium heckeshornense]BCO33846.1 hypothetical protein MHEC_02790 [Mycobacterium heckeshornense]BCQ06897.1 hypothetical protein JMUB5695_00311 [Mycobacterium heckeshornense]
MSTRAGEGKQRGRCAGVDRAAELPHANPSVEINWCGSDLDGNQCRGRDHRPQLATLLAYARARDVLLMWRLDRLCRPLAHLLKLVSGLEACGIGLRFSTVATQTSSAGGRLMFVRDIGVSIVSSAAIVLIGTIPFALWFFR